MRHPVRVDPDAEVTFGGIDPTTGDYIGQFETCNVACDVVHVGIDWQVEVPPVGEGRLGIKQLAIAGLGPVSDLKIIMLIDESQSRLARWLKTCQ